MSKNLQESQSSEEVDLGQLFKLIGNAFNRLFKFIGSILNSLFLAFVWLVFFTKKHILKIVLAGVLGFSFGFVNEKISDPIYKSSIVVKQNYNTGENLYSVINYYNDLISDKDSMALSNILKITPKEANTISDLTVETILDENQKLRIYDSYSKELDSVLASSMDFEAYKERSHEYDYDYQRIILKASSQNIFNQVFPKIVQNVESSTFFKNEQKKDLAELSRREAIIKESLKESDSLQKVYQLVLEKSVESTSGSQTSVTIDNTEDKGITKEFELYNIDLELRRELVDIDRKKENIEHIIEIVSSDKSLGTIDNSEEIFGYAVSNKILYGLLFSLLVFIVLISLEFFKHLERFKVKIYK
jgi:hypothetical protein